MRRFMWVVVLTVAVVLPAHAQETPQVELMGGYSYLRSDIGGVDQGFNGWNGSITENLNHWLGGTADFSGYYAHPGGINVNTHTFMFGPHFAYRKSGSVTPFAHVLIGGMRASQGYLGISQSKTDFAAALGGGVDIKVHKIISIRVVQAEYVYTPYLNMREDNLRVSAGIVLRFGRK